MTAGIRPIIAVVGPTASGKSELGIELALRFGGEVVNCDSVQVYRGLYVATAKVPPAEQRNVPHHLIDVVEPAADFTAANFAALARSKLAEVEARGHLAILVGGTGFYLRALLGGLFEGAPTDPAVRARIRRILERHGAHHLHRMLRRVDPASAARLNPNDWSRTTRALEVYFQTGEPISTQQQHMPEPPEIARRTHIFALNPPRAELYERINRRTDQMFAASFIEEVKSLLAAGVPEEAKAFGAHGYRRVLEHLRGSLTLAQAIEQTKLDTRHYAKRQLTWWRNQAQVIWLDGFGYEPRVIEEASSKIALLLAQA